MGSWDRQEHHYLNLRTIKLDLIKPQAQECLVRNEKEIVILLKKTIVKFVQDTIEEYCMKTQLFILVYLTQN